MPDFGTLIDDRQEEYHAGCTLVWVDGKAHTISLRAEDNVTKDEVDDWASAIGACSNSGLRETRTEARWWTPDITDVLVYDEAGKDAVFVFQSQRNPGLVQYVTIPNFDASLFNSGSILLDEGEVPLVISRSLGILNKHDVLESDPEYVFVKAYLKKGNSKTHVTLPLGDTDHGVDIEEPTALGNPGGDPAGVI